MLDLVPSSQEREGQVFLALALLIGALTGLVVVAFIVLTERLGMRLYPIGGAAWRRLVFPVAGSIGIGYLLFKYFPNARGSGVPQTKAALYAREGRILLRTVFGKFFCHFSDARERNPARTRRTFCSSWRGYSFCAWAFSWTTCRKGQSPFARRRCSGNCGGFQYTAGSGALCGRRSRWRPARTDDRLGCLSLRNLLAGATRIAWK